MENRLLKRLSGLSKSAIEKTRVLLGGEQNAPEKGSSRRKAPAEISPPEKLSSESGSPAGAPPGGASSRGLSSSGRKARTGGAKKRAGAASGAPAGSSDEAGAPRIVPHGEHPVSRKDIGRSALKVLERLHEGGFAACLVGGGVRDALVGIAPKDFDIATDASPEDVRALFRNSRIIGRRFRLVHVVFGREIIEVATFRAAHDKGEGGEVGASGRIVRDNVFGSIAEDARRRDFSVNALYYNIADRSVIDYVGGLEDMEKKVFRLIGDPLTRCEEDPVRVLRAVRLGAKLGFSIEPETGRAMKKVAPELRHTPPARLFEEVLKLFQGGYAERSFAAVIEHDLLRYLFPMLERRLREQSGAQAGAGGKTSDRESLRVMLDAALANTDRRVAQGKPITPAYLLAFMLWPDVEEQARAECALGSPVHDALQGAAESVLARQLRVISIPRRFSGPMKEIWQMQPRLERQRGARALALMEERRFRAAYDFLCLRARVDPRLAAVAEWWTDVQELPEEERAEAAASRPLAEGLWPGANGDGAVPPPEGEGGRGEASSRQRRRGGRRRDGGKGRSGAPTGHGGAEDGGERERAGTDGEAGKSTTDTAPATASAAPGGSSSDGVVTAPGDAGSADAGGAPSEGASPKKRRRRRRRRPGGDKSRSPGGSDR